MCLLDVVEGFLNLSSVLLDYHLELFLNFTFRRLQNERVVLVLQLLELSLKINLLVFDHLFHALHLSIHLSFNVDWLRLVSLALERNYEIANNFGNHAFLEILVFSSDSLQLIGRVSQFCLEVIYLNFGVVVNLLNCGNTSS